MSGEKDINLVLLKLNACSLVRLFKLYLKLSIEYNNLQNNKTLLITDPSCHLNILMFSPSDNHKFRYA